MKSVIYDNRVSVLLDLISTLNFNNEVRKCWSDRVKKYYIMNL